MLKANQIKTMFAAYLVVSLIYVLSHCLVCSVLTPIQAKFFPEITKYASFFYLPHGVRVIATAILGARAIPALIVG